MLAAYVSGHGYGHLVRLCEVLRTVRSLDAALPITLTGTVPEALVRRDVADPLALRPLACDVGLAQRGALEIDEPGTAAACEAFERGWDDAVEREAAFLRRAGARLVLADVPALAFEAAARACVPAVACTNFSWDWIYRHLGARQPRLLESADRAARAYRTAALLLELPFAGDLSAFPRREPVGFVARRPSLPREEVRRRLSLDGRPAVLVSFGGIGVPALGRERLATDPSYQWLFQDDLEERRLSALGLRYVDAVGASDVVVTKPGYGIVTDAIGAGVRLVYTERGDFPEYDVLVRELPRWLAAVHVSNADLRAGRLAGPIARVLAMPVPPAPPLDGAARAARRVLELIATAR